MKALQELREMIAEKKAGEQDMRVFLVNLIRCISCQYYQMYFLTIIQCISSIHLFLQYYQMCFFNIIKCFSTGSFRKNDKSKMFVKILIFTKIKFSQLF